MQEVSLTEDGFALEEDGSPQKVVVVFRISKKGTGEVLALFPEEPADDAGRYCTAYSPVGGHSAASYHHCISQTHPARPHEYARLLKDLKRIGYDPEVRQRWQRKRR
jgi:hypothetical protein